MAKKKVAKPKHVVTKRQLSRWQRQKRRQRLIRGLGISIIIAVVGLVSAGIYYQWYLPEYKPLRQTVIEVNDTKFDMEYYIDALNYQLGDYYYLAQYYLDLVIEGIQQNELIRQEALELGISISDDEVDEALGGSGLSVNQAVRDMVRAQLLVTKLGEEYFEPQVPLSAEQRYIMAMFLESEEQAVDVRTRLEAGEDFAQIAGELSLESLTQEENGDLGWRPEGVLDDVLGTSVLDSYLFNCQVGVLSQPIYDGDKTKNLGYWLIEVLERDEEAGEALVQAMLLSSEEEAKGIIARLEAGEDFVELAEEFSQYGTEGSKADIGWIAEGDMTQAFEEFVFDPETEVNIISEPIYDETPTTRGGYWLFEVLDDDIREISEENRDLLVADALDDWLLSLWDDPENTIVSYLDEEMRAFVINKVSGG